MAMSLHCCTLILGNHLQASVDICSAHMVSVVCDYFTTAPIARN